MPYLGNPAVDRFTSTKAASVYSGDGSTVAFTLEHSVGADEDILVSVDGVIQEPSVAYAVSSGTTLTFTAAPSSNSGNNIFVYYLFRTIGTVTHPPTSALSATSGTFTGALTGTTSHFTSTGQVAKFESSNNGLQVEFNYQNNTSRAFMGTFSNGLSLAPSSASTAINIDANGIVTKPNQPAFLAQPASLQSNFAVGSEVTIAFGTEVFDVGGNFASNTFTAPVTGKYLVCFSIYLQTIDTASNYYEARIISSNRKYYPATIDPDFADADFNYFSLTGSSVVDMDADDTVTIAIKQATGTAQSDINTPSFFSGYLLG